VQSATLGGLLALSLAVALPGCAANCLRDSDCDDAHECRRDRCVLPSASQDASAGAAEAGSAGMISPGMGGMGGMGGASTVVEPSQGGAAGAQGGSAGMDSSSGGSATVPRENLDASADADADASSL
jgi:hypothetical protein